MIVITGHFIHQVNLGWQIANEPFGLLVKLPPTHLSTTHGGGLTLSLIAERRAGKL